MVEAVHGAYVVTLLVCIVYGFVVFRSIPLPLQIIVSYVLASVIAETIGFYTLKIQSKPQWNTLNYNLYTLAEVGLLGAYFYQIILTPRIRLLIIGISSFLLVINLVQSLQGSYFLDDSNAKMYLTIGVYHILLSLLFFIQIIQQNEPDLFKPDFWVCTGFLFFYGGGFLLTGLIEYLVQTDITLAQQVFTLNHLLNIVLYSLIGYAFFVAWKNQKSLLSSSEEL